MFLVDDDARLVNGKRIPLLTAIVAELSEDGRLSLEFPGGARVEDDVRRGEEMKVRFFSRTCAARAIEGPFSSALSEYAGVRLRLVARADGLPAVDRGEQGAVTLLSLGSARAVARAAGREAIDLRRFRMTLELDGLDAFDEDEWIGRELRAGAARLHVLGHVGRCSVTTLDPDRGTRDLPTLDLLRELRAGAATTEPLALGVHCTVLEPGEVAVGDPVSLAA
jgi:uncharacterized protein